MDSPRDRFSDEALLSGLPIHSADEMEDFGAWLASRLPKNSLVTLSGTLGVGKTTLVRGIARGLGIKSNVSSPTFNLYNIHQGDPFMLLHMDAYRLESSDDLDTLMLDDFLIEPWVWVLEWPEKIIQGLQRPYIKLSLSIVDEVHIVRLDPELD